MSINEQKIWRTMQIVASEIMRYDGGAQIYEMPENRNHVYDLLVTSKERGLQYGVEVKRSEFSRTKNYDGYIERLQHRQSDINVPILLVSVNESTEEVKIGIVFSWFHRRPSVTRDVVLWKSTRENWDRALNLLALSAHVESPIEFLQMDNLYLKKTLPLSAEIRGGRRYLAELVYMRKMSPEYRMNPRERNTQQEEFQFCLNGYDREEYPSDILDNAIYMAVHEQFVKTDVNNQLIVLNTELRDLQRYREYERGSVNIHIAPQLDGMDEAVMRLLGGHTEFDFRVELYAHSAEDRDYYNNMDFSYQDVADGWVEKVIEYRKGQAGCKKLSDIIG